MGGALLGALIGTIIILVTNSLAAEITGPLWVLGGAVIGKRKER